MRAALSGVIDFSQARIREISWWRKTNILIREMARLDEIETMRDAYKFQCALISNGSLTKDSFEKSQTGAKETFQELFNVRRPWAATSIEESGAKEVQGMMDKYKRLIGDPRDPTFMAQMQENAKKIREAASDVPEETDEQRVDRKLREQAEARMAQQRR